MIGEILLLASALAEPGLGRLTTGQRDAAMAAYVELEIDARGRVERCRLIEPAARNGQACRGIEGQIIAPARFGTGEPAPARLRTTLGNPSSAPSYTEPADLELSTKGLPNGAKSIQTRVVLEIDNVGALVGCRAASGTGLAVLTPAACAALRKIAFAQMIGRNGRPIFYVTTQVVRFTAP